MGQEENLAQNINVVDNSNNIEADRQMAIKNLAEEIKNHLNSGEKPFDIMNLPFKKNEVATYLKTTGFAFGAISVQSIEQKYLKGNPNIGFKMGRKTNQSTVFSDFMNRVKAVTKETVRLTV